MAYKIGGKQQGKEASEKNGNKRKNKYFYFSVSQGSLMEDATHTLCVPLTHTLCSTHT